MDRYGDKKVIILQIETFIIYQILPYCAPLPITSYETNIFWSDYYNMAGSGPFETIFQAGMDYERVQRERRKNPQKPIMVVENKAPVIHVDFRGKRRL